MSGYQNKAQAIRKAQQQISKRIRAVQEQLKFAETLPSTQPWITFSRGQRVADLRSPFSNLREALTHDLFILKNQMKELKGEARRLEYTAARQRAEQASTDFRKTVGETLKRAEQRGYLEEGELGTLLKPSEKVLERLVGLLEANPSTKNIGMVLDAMGTSMLLGFDRMDSTGTCGRAWRSLGRAADKIQDGVERNFRKNPTVANFDKLLQAKQISMQIGGSLRGRPAGWHGAKSGTVHTVSEDDSLSGISQKYYGSPAYWDIIYMENCKIIGDNPDNLRVGLKVVIP